jgi:hypothetical protein
VNVYIYEAAFYCEDCGIALRRTLDEKGERPADPDDEHTYDSDEYPKGPYPDSGGEADCPQHCDGCGLFLENPLTSDGVEYVREAIRRRYFSQQGSAKPAPEWAEFYGLPTTSKVADFDHVYCFKCGLKLSPPFQASGFVTGHGALRGQCTGPFACEAITYFDLDEEVES